MDTKDNHIESHQSSLVILFANVIQSTNYYKELGEVPAMEIVSRALWLLHAKIIRNEGRTIKTIGDEIMCVFLDPRQAVEAAFDMQKAIKTDPLLTHSSVSLKIGLHFGEVICEQNDVFGDTVNFAARAAALAKAGQIVTTRSTMEKVPKDMISNPEFPGRLKFKQLDEKADFFEIQEKIPGEEP